MGGLTNSRIMEKKKRCYNSGPISSLPGTTAWFNFQRADKVIAERLGMKPVNPMDITWGIPWKAPWIVHMIKDILLLLSCSCAYFQEGWEKSRGARWEFKVACWTGKEIFLYREKRVAIK